MKNNNFLIALALCLGLSSTTSFCMDAPEQAPSSDSWYTPSALWKSAQNAAAYARDTAASAFNWIDTRKTALHLQNWSYRQLGAIIAILAAAAYKKEDIIALVSTIYDKIAPTITTAGTSIGTGATYVVGKAKAGAGYMGGKAGEAAEYVKAGAGYMRGKAGEAATYAPHAIPVGATAIAVTAGYKALGTLKKAAAKKEAEKKALEEQLRIKQENREQTKAQLKERTKLFKEKRQAEKEANQQAREQARQQAREQAKQEKEETSKQREEEQPHIEEDPIEKAHREYMARINQI